MFHQATPAAYRRRLWSPFSKGQRQFDSEEAMKQTAHTLCTTKTKPKLFHLCNRAMSLPVSSWCFFTNHDLICASLDNLYQIVLRPCHSFAFQQATCVSTRDQRDAFPDLPLQLQDIGRASEPKASDHMEFL